MAETFQALEDWQGEFPRTLGENSRTGSEIVQTGPRTVMVGNVEFYITPKNKISERGTGWYMGRNDFSGIRGMRYEFLLNEAPYECQAMDFSGQMEPYLDKVERRYNERVYELMQGWMPKIEAVTDTMERIQTYNSYHAQAREMATKEIIEAL